MRRRPSGAALGGILALALSAAPATAQDFEWSRQMGAGDVLEVKGITGSIRAELASGSMARVTAEKHGRSGDLDDVEIRAVEIGDGYEVCAVYGPRQRGEDTCRNNHGRDNDHGDRSIDVDVEFVVYVPSGVEFVGAMVTGDVEARGLDGDVTANSVTGDVIVSTTGAVRANTVSGDLDVEMGRLDGDQRFHTVSGDITLRLPRELDADLRFESLSGDLDSDIDLDISRHDGKWIGTDIRATLGRGGPRIALKTVSGDARLRHSRENVR